MYKPTIMHIDGLSEGSNGILDSGKCNEVDFKVLRGHLCISLQTKVCDGDGECAVFISVKIGCCDVVTTHSHMFSNGTVQTE